MQLPVLRGSIDRKSRARFSFEQALLLLPAKKLTMSPAAPVRPLLPPQLSLRSWRPGQAEGALLSDSNGRPMLHMSAVSKMPAPSAGLGKPCGHHSRLSAFVS